jgi:hypothetical protein
MRQSSVNTGPTRRCSEPLDATRRLFTTDRIASTPNLELVRPFGVAELGVRPMNDTLYFSLFTILMAMVFIWFGLCIWVFRRLENRHHEKYIELGKPSLFLRNNIQNNWFFIRFLWRAEYSTLNDPSLSKTCNFMKIFFIIYSLLFFSLILRFFTHLPQRQA